VVRVVNSELVSGVASMNQKVVRSLSKRMVRRVSRWGEPPREEFGEAGEVMGAQPYSMLTVWGRRR
jgi:hypothetical protein